MIDHFNPALPAALDDVIQNGVRLVAVRQVDPEKVDVRVMQSFLDGLAPINGEQLAGFPERLGH